MALKFQPAGKESLQKELRTAVYQYFKDRDISINGDYRMIIKSSIILLLYFIPFVLILTNTLPIWAMWLLTVFMGLSVAGIGMGIMHDACHNSYSSNKIINRILSYSLNLVGGNRFNWIIQHNIKHHTYTNIYGEDEDIDNGGLIRLSPYAERKGYHKFQHIYSWFLYALATLSWVIAKDFRQFFQYKKEQRGKSRYNFKKELAVLIISKILFFSYMLILPYFILDLPLWMIIVGFLTIHLVAGFVLTVTFQTAHVVENTEHHTAVGHEGMFESWVKHQVKTTADFSRNSKFLNWYLGGLNFQIEHHLFPNICHIHYKNISEIVEKVVEKHGLSYNQYPTFSQAVKSHYRTLKHFGESEQLIPQTAS